jgi:Zinc finger, C2H2 type
MVLLPDRYFLSNSFIERFECACLQKYQSRVAAQRCLARHIGEKPYKCTHNDCHFDFYTESELQSHEKRIHLEPAVHERVVCNECGASVAKQYLRLHWRKAHTPPVPCSVCQKMYKNSIRLRIHMRTVHEKVKYFRCRVCHKRFVRRSSANLCRAKHGQERMACNFCERMFHTSAQRNSHRLTVHGKLEQG